MHTIYVFPVNYSEFPVICHIDFSNHWFFITVNSDLLPLHIYTVTEKWGKSKVFSKTWKRKRVFLKFRRPFKVVFTASELKPARISSSKLPFCCKTIFMIRISQVKKSFRILKQSITPTRTNFFLGKTNYFPGIYSSRFLVTYHPYTHKGIIVFRET